MPLSRSMTFRNVCWASTAPSLVRLISTPRSANLSGEVPTVRFILLMADSTASASMPISPATSMNRDDFSALRPVAVENLPTLTPSSENLPARPTRAVPVTLAATIAPVPNFVSCADALAMPESAFFSSFSAVPPTFSKALIAPLASAVRTNLSLSVALIAMTYTPTESKSSSNTTSSALGAGHRGNNASSNASGLAVYTSERASASTC